jgi:hypothetical protein
MSIQSLVGLLEKDVFVSVKGVDGLHKVRLQVVEKYGVWVENEELVKMLLSGLGWEAGSQKVVFLPFAEIRLIVSGCEAGLAQKRFGWHGAEAAPANRR